MECDNKTCNNTAITVIQYLDTDDVIHKIPVCKSCQDLEYKPGMKCFQVIPQ